MLITEKARQPVPISWHTSNGSFLTKGRTEVIVRLLHYSKRKDYTDSPNLAEYNKKKITKPV